MLILNTKNVFNKDSNSLPRPDPATAGITHIECRFSIILPATAATATVVCVGDRVTLVAILCPCVRGIHGAINLVGFRQFNQIGQVYATGEPQLANGAC